jgi:hypothetical protein
MQRDTERSVHADLRGYPWPCKYCGLLDIWYTTSETFDGAYDRYYYHCRDCDKRWTVVDETD